MENKMKKRIFRKVISVVVIIAIIFLILIIRNMIIMTNLRNKRKDFINENNYYARVKSYQEDSIITTETYYKDGKYLTKMKKGNDKLIVFYNGTSTNMYFDANDEKVAILNSPNEGIKVMISDYLYTENIGQFLINSVVSKITSKECNGKDCYYISGAMTSNTMEGENTGAYIDKNTGLTVRMGEGTTINEEEKFDIISDSKYKFNTVTDDDLKEPDISEYTIKEVNN